MIRLKKGNRQLILECVTKFNDDLQFVIIAIFSQKKALAFASAFFNYIRSSDYGMAKYKANADPFAFGIFRTIRAPASPLFLAIHKVFLRKSAIAGTRILSESALADRIVVCLKRGFSP